MNRLPVPVLPRWLRVAAAVGVAAAIFVASVVDPPSSGQPVVVLGIAQDKWLHAVAYAGLAGAVGYAALPGAGRLGRRALAGAFLVAAAYGVGIEFVQAPLPARAFDPADALANAVGAALGVLPWLGLRGR